MIYDISPEITSNLKVWPGDTQLKREVLADIRKGNNYTLSTLHATVHLGAHADAPNHYLLNGKGIGEQALDFYIGRCQVIHVQVERKSLISVMHIGVPIVAERVLFRTNTFPNPNHFNEDFSALSPELIEYLANQGVILVGIDTPSVDLFSSKSLDAHHMICKNNMAILEGIILSEVPSGIYELVALPLKLIEFDASPVRAILRTIS